MPSIVKEFVFTIYTFMPNIVKVRCECFIKVLQLTEQKATLFGYLLCMKLLLWMKISWDFWQFNHEKPGNMGFYALNLLITLKSSCMIFCVKIA